MGATRAWSTGIEKNISGVPLPGTIQVSSDGGDITGLHDDTSLPVDQWVHFAGVYTPGISLEVYLNGDSSAIRTDSIPEFQFSTNFQPVLIGNRPQCGNCGWYGFLDEVRLYDAALTESEIEDLMGPPATTAGDFDIDGDVDGSDFLIWQRGESPNPLSTSDLDDWRMNFGATGGPIVAAMGTIPEPATWSMLLMGLVGVLMMKRPCKRS
jgi:hypothetical protein